MSTYTQLLYQIVFRSQDFTSFLTEENEDMLFNYIAGVLKNNSCHSYIVGGAINHLHIVTHIHPSIAPADIVKDIKLATRSMISKEKKIFKNFRNWQVGYGLFTYHISAKDNLINYVKNQKSHHGVLSYEDELKNMLRDNEIDFREEYLFT
jgi:REP element-mobilizing transposase RayT